MTKEWQQIKASAAELADTAIKISRTDLSDKGEDV